jgi:hypothetical protein
VAQEGLGDPEKAKQSRTQATTAATSGGRGRFEGRGGGLGRASGGDAQQYWQAMSLRKLEQEQKPVEILQQMVKNGTDQLQARAESDYSAASGRRQSLQGHAANAHYTAGLGYLGPNEKEKAKEQLAEAPKVSPSHLGARTERALLD